MAIEFHRIDDANIDIENKFHLTVHLRLAVYETACLLLRAGVR